MREKLTPITQKCRIIDFDFGIEHKENKKLTTDEIRFLDNENKILCSDLESFKELSLKENNTKDNSNFRNSLSECIHDTIINLYSIIKDNKQGVN